MAYLDKKGGPIAEVMYSTGSGVGKDFARMVFSADLIASNSVAITVNGAAMTPVVFTTSNYNTLNLICAQLVADCSAVGSATILVDTLGGQTYNKILITGSTANTELTFTAYAVTLGASQAKITFENDQGDIKERAMILTDSINTVGESIVQPLATSTTTVAYSNAVLATAITTANTALALLTTKRVTNFSATWDGTNHNLIYTLCAK